MSSSDTWSQLQAHKRKHENLRERLMKRRKERQGLLDVGTAAEGSREESDDGKSENILEKIADDTSQPTRKDGAKLAVDADIERYVIEALCAKQLIFPASVEDVISKISERANLDAKKERHHIENVLSKLDAQKLVSLKNVDSGKSILDCEYAKLDAVLERLMEKEPQSTRISDTQRQRRDSDKTKGSAFTEVIPKHNPSRDHPETMKDDSVESLLSMPTMKEKENKKAGEEILELLNQPTAKELSLMENFKSQGGTSVKEFCVYGTLSDCRRNNTDKEKCKRLHFKKIIQKHTDESLGDCSFLNTCFHMDTCKYVHYEVDYSSCTRPRGGDKNADQPDRLTQTVVPFDKQKITLYPPQWIQCDVRSMDFSALGKFSVIMADPPWDIHMELPYGTMSDDEMRTLPIREIQDDGFIFLWVTGRAMELGRECLLLWGYESCDELIWVKTNQLQRLIRTGRTGHWLNHGKEHCLVGVKGNPTGFNRGLDCDVLVSEVRDTSHKPDEIYGLIERLAPGKRKIELFGRQHNVQPNWVTLGNQLRGINLIDPEVVKLFKEKYPDGDCLKGKTMA